MFENYGFFSPPRDPGGVEQPSRSAETRRFLATPPEPGTSVSPSTLTDVQQLHVEIKNDREKSRRLVQLYVHDMERAKGFYEKALGVSLTQLKQSGGSLENMWAFPMNRDGSGATGALAKMDGAAVGAGGTIIYFVCDDCAQAAKRAKDAGGHVVKDKLSIGDYGNIALVSDPDGNVVGFHSMA
jgi:uncharacterized protein